MSKKNNRAKIRLFRPSFVAALMLGATSLALAQALVDISGCARLTDDKQRYACYDDLARAAGALPPNTVAAPTAKTDSAPPVASPPIASPIAPSVAAPAKSTAPTAAPEVATTTDSARIAAFGNASQARLEADTSGQEMLVDSITTLKLYQQNIWQLTLSSGQVWRQMQPRRFQLRKGDKVHIVPNPWGDSFRLSAEGRSGFIQVEKITGKL
jgi:hypothetical protein